MITHRHHRLELLELLPFAAKNENERAIIDTNYVYGAPYYGKRQTLVVDENVMYPKQLSLDGSDSESKGPIKILIVIINNNLISAIQIP